MKKLVAKYFQITEKILQKYFDETAYFIDEDIYDNVAFIANKDDFLCAIIFDFDEIELDVSFNFQIDPFEVLKIQPIIEEIADEVGLDLYYSKSWVTEAKDGIAYPLYKEEAYERMGYKPLKLEFKESHEK